MALWLSKVGVTVGRYLFLYNLLNQLSSPLWPTHQDYEYSPDFMWNSPVTFIDGVEKEIPSACIGGPSGQCRFKKLGK